MLRCFFIIALFAMLIPAYAQESETPDYALAFRVGDEVQIATYSEASGWQVAPLPNYMLFGQYDISLTMPRWTADGQLVGVGYDPAQTGSQELYDLNLPATYLYRYDLATQAMNIAGEKIGDIAAQEYMPPTLNISSVSPDGRYATLYDLTYTLGFLINVETQEVLYMLDSCGLKAQHWTETSVFVGSSHAYITCPAVFMEIDLATGEVLQDFSAAFEGQDITVIDEAYLLNDSDFLLAAYGLEYYYKLVHLNAENATIISELSIGDLRVSESKRAAAFSADLELDGTYDLIYFNLETGESTPILPVDTLITHAFEGETLHYLVQRMPDSQTQVLAGGAFTPGAEPTETILYQGKPSSTFIASPIFASVALCLEEGCYVYGEGGLIWEMSRVLEEPQNNDLRWSPDGTWLYLDTVDFNTGESSTLAINTATGESIEPPAPHATFVSASPDGHWWLYLVRDPETLYEDSTLLAFDPATGESVTLSEGAWVYDNFHWGLSSLFVWSPPLE